jgi:hypothetical protein
MIDPGTGLTILGSAIGGAKVVEKILGPTSEYIGEQLKEWTVKKIANTANIFKNAEKKLGDKMNEPGKVPPKILKAILEDGAWCEEKLQVEYFGGVLASSRTGVSRDDRGAYYTTLISRMSTYQLRTHYLIYHLAKKLYDGQEVNIHDGNNWKKLEMLIPFTTFYLAMDFTQEEAPEWNKFLSHAVWGLNKEELVAQFRWGEKEHVQKAFPQAATGGILLQPTKIGTELFMWAYGHGQLDANEFFRKEMAFPNDQEIRIGDVISTEIAREEARKATEEERKNNT